MNLGALSLMDEYILIEYVCESNICKYLYCIRMFTHTYIYMHTNIHSQHIHAYTRIQIQID